MIAVYALIFGVMIVLSGTVIFGLWWAITRGQFSDFQKGATSIFDADEPIGRRTDSFPDD